jgi:HSP20 family protein
MASTMKASGMPAPRSREVFPAWYRMFDDFERGMLRWPTFFHAKSDGVVPELDVIDHADCITIEAELPGVDTADLSVTMIDDTLIIKGEKKHGMEEKEDENYYLAERSYGGFERSLRLPDTIDYAKVEAMFDKGVLKVTAPKKPEVAKVDRRIDVKWVS